MKKGHVNTWAATGFLEIPLAILNDVVWSGNETQTNEIESNLDKKTYFVISIVDADVQVATSAAGTVTTKLWSGIYTGFGLEGPKPTYLFVRLIWATCTSPTS